MLRKNSLLILPFLFLGACATSHTMQPEPFRLLPVPINLGPNEDLVNMTGELRGRVIVEDGCLFLSSGDQRHLVILPSSFEWDGRAFVEDKTYKKIRPGQKVSKAGGILPVNTPTQNTPPDECRADGFTSLA